MKKLVVIILSLQFLGGCVTSSPLPENGQPITVIEYTDSLIQATTPSVIDRMIDTMDRVSNKGYRSMKGFWCPRHESVHDAPTVLTQFRQECTGRGGRYDGAGFCVDIENRDEVIFVVTVKPTRKCTSGGRSVDIEVIEPIASRQNSLYTRELRRRGFETTLEAEHRQFEELQQAAVQQAQAAQEAAQQQARRAAIADAGIGTRICRAGDIEYVFDPGIREVRRRPGTLIAQLDGHSEDKSRVRIRVLGFSIRSQPDYETPYSHSHRMGEFTIQPGTVYWDKAGNWAICEQ